MRARALRERTSGPAHRSCVSHVVSIDGIRGRLSVEKFVCFFFYYYFLIYI
jgi:hypothetical protein